MPTIRALVPVLALGVVVLGCDGDDDDGQAAVDRDGVESATDEDGDGAVDGPGSGPASDDSASDDAETDGAETDGAETDAAATDDAADEGVDATTDDERADLAGGGAQGAAGGLDLVDLTTAEPGSWPVGNAGTVTFDLDGRDLVLRDISGAPGWSIEVEEDERDEIEVVYRRDDVRWRFEVERSGRHLEVTIQQRIDRADTGGYDLGDAGTFAFDVVDGRLVLTSLEVADGWHVRDRDEDDDDIELDLRADDRRVEVEVELDDGSVELEIVYQIRNRIR